MRWDKHKAGVLNGRNLEGRLVCQPASSPDTNILDLGVFASIQSRQLKHFSTNFNQLIDLVEDAFDKMETTVLRKLWHTLAMTQNAIIEQRGDNDYVMPRSGLKQGAIIPSHIPASEACIEAATWVIQRLEQRLETEKAVAEQRREQFRSKLSLMPAWMRAVDKRDKTQQQLDSMRAKLVEISEAAADWQATMEDDKVATEEVTAQI